MWTYDRKVTLLTLAAGLPAVIASFVLLWVGQYPWLIRVTVGTILFGLWLGVTIALRDRIIRPLQTVSNLLAALREDDFSIRARGAMANDALGQVMLEVNTLAETLRSQRLGAQEATVLLRAVMAEIDVAIFAFDSNTRLVLVNRYGERLLGREGGDLIGQIADDLGLQHVLGSPSTIQDLSFPGGVGRWEIRRTKFWQGGSPHELVALSDLSQPLREQERQAWRRLIRVIGHELNNSLAPIKSIAGSLESLLSNERPPDDWRDDMRSGLAVIGSRADALSRFTTAYARLARLPAPSRRPVEFSPLMRRVVSLETGGGVTTSWFSSDHMLEVRIDDEGPGLQNTGNLFVPFFTTKAGGSGIGLVLSRQIAEGHGGSLTLENRADDEHGVRATLRIPL